MENGIDKQLFRRAMGHFATGITVVTTQDETGRCWGMTANAFSSLSLEPALVLICIDKRAGSYEAFCAASHFCVNFLSAEQQAVSNHFASQLEDKFAAIEFAEGICGAPVLAGTIGYVECSRYEILPGGDHVILTGKVENIAVPGGEPLLYFAGQYRSLLPIV